VALTAVGLSGRLNTAFVERVSLTLRQSVAALVRRTWSTVQDVPQLLVHVDWWRAYYHFVRPHESLRVLLTQPIDRRDKRLPQRYRQRTPAMAAGLTGKRWTVQELRRSRSRPRRLVLAEEQNGAEKANHSDGQWAW
jgi:Integrase core domain